MKLTHTGNDGLSRLFVRIGLKGGILLCQLLESNSHFFLTGLRLRLNSHADDRIREFHGFEDDRILFITERVAGGGVFKADGGGDIAGINLLDILSVVGVHTQDASKTLTLSLGRIHNGLTGLHRA